jgi:hypothetical protein
VGANDIIGDGREAWWWVPSGGIASINAPTIIEVNAGIRISQWMTKYGANGFAADTAPAPTSGIEDRFDTSIPGRISYNGMKLRLRDQSGTDVAKNTLVYGAAGFLVRRRSIDAKTAVATGQKVRVWPVTCGEQVDMDYEDNMPQRYEVPIFPSATPSSGAAIA